MIEKEINSCKKCIVCTGCGRGAGKQEGLQAVSNVSALNALGAKQNSYTTMVGIDKNALLIATDIGTTTIVMQLRRMQDGEVLDTFRAINPQRKYGLDVLSRIRAAGTTSEVAEDMRNMVHRVLKQGIEQFSKDRNKADVKGMVIAANTTMVHLLMGYSVDTIGKAPFTSEHLDEIETNIAGISTIVMPGISVFVGADILAGMYVYGPDWSTEENEVLSPVTRKYAADISLLLDLGTNGEMVLGNSEKLLATATAAGPAFEGRLDASVWGADAIGFLAKLYEKGFVDETGLLADEYFENGVTIGNTVMTQADIRSLQLAKAAVNAGITVLCGEFGLEDLSDIQRVYLAGGFGYFLNPKDAVSIGLLPRELENKCVAVGNAALEGAFCYGRERLSRAAASADFSLEAIRRINSLKMKTQVYNLAQAHKFEQCYIEAINLP